MGKNEIIYSKFSEDEQNKIIEKLINTQIKNKQLINEIRREFESKNLQYSKASAVFNLLKDFNELTTNEKIAFITASYRVLQKEDLIPDRFFGKNSLVEYQMFTNQDEKFETIKLEQVRRINDFEYQGYMPDKITYLCMKHGLFYYNINTQRPYEAKAIGDKGKYLRQLDINWKNVNEMVELMKEGKFEDTEITLNVRRIVGYDANFRFTPQWNDIGVFEVTPNYDTNSEDFTIVDIADGTHRLLAKEKYVDWYYKEHNEYPPETQGIKVAIKVRTEEQCKEFIRQVFQRADVIDKEYIENLKVDEYSIFTKELVEKSEDILKGNVGERYEDILVNNKITNYTLLKDTIKKFVKIDFNSVMKKNDKSDSLVKNIDMIVKYLCEKYYSNNLESMKEEGIFINNGIFAVYLILANMIDEKIINMKYEEIIDILFNAKDSEEFKELKLKNKIIDLDEVKKFIDNNFKERVENV